MADDLQTEQLLAVIDPRKVMDGTATLRIGQIRAAAELPKRIRKRVMHFMATAEFQPDTSPLENDEYGTTLTLVTAAALPSDRLFAVVPDREIATDLANATARIKAWGAQNIPRDDTDTFLGNALSLPPALYVSDFMAQWRAACDPMVAIADLEDGQLDDDVVAVVAQLWPALYAEMRQSVVDAYTALAARRPTWEPEPQKRLLLNTLLQSDQIDYALAATVQQSQVNNDQNSAPTSSGGEDENSDTKSGEATPGQRAAAA